jgi:hypothetical protein
VPHPHVAVGSYEFDCKIAVRGTYTSMGTVVLTCARTFSVVSVHIKKIGVE